MGENELINWFPSRLSQLIFMLILVEGAMPLGTKERSLTLCSYAAGRCSVCVTWEKLVVLQCVCVEWEMWSVQAAESWRCRCSQKTQGTYEPKLFRKSALKHRLTPAGFPEHLQKLLICSYERQLMMVNMVTIHRRGVCALSKKVSFMAAYAFPSLFLTSFASVMFPPLLLWSSLSSCLHLLLYSLSYSLLLPRNPPFSWPPLCGLAVSPRCNACWPGAQREGGQPHLVILQSVPAGMIWQSLSWIFLSSLSMWSSASPEKCCEIGCAINPLL